MFVVAFVKFMFSYCLITVGWYLDCVAFSSKRFPRDVLFSGGVKDSGAWGIDHFGTPSALFLPPMILVHSVDLETLLMTPKMCIVLRTISPSMLIPDLTELTEFCIFHIAKNYYTPF